MRSRIACRHKQRTRPYQRNSLSRNALDTEVCPGNTIIGAAPNVVAGVALGVQERRDSVPCNSPHALGSLNVCPIHAAVSASPNACGRAVFCTNQLGRTSDKATGRNSRDRACVRCPCQTAIDALEGTLHVRRPSREPERLDVGVEARPGRWRDEFNVRHGYAGAPPRSSKPIAKPGYRQNWYSLLTSSRASARKPNCCCTALSALLAM